MNHLSNSGRRALTGSMKGIPERVCPHPNIIKKVDIGAVPNNPASLALNGSKSFHKNCLRDAPRERGGGGVRETHLVSAAGVPSPKGIPIGNHPNLFSCKGQLNMG